MAPTTSPTIPTLTRRRTLDRLKANQRRRRGCEIAVGTRGQIDGDRLTSNPGRAPTIYQRADAAETDDEAGDSGEDSYSLEAGGRRRRRRRAT